MKVNEIFYSIQGEGRYTGTPAVFVRLSGCNLKCWFCDTDHDPGTEMSEEDIVAAVCRYPARHVVITGGEPTLQLTATLVERLHRSGCFVQIETNGTLPLPEDCRVDWVTCSPKTAHPVITPIHELKVIFDGTHPVDDFSQIPAQEYRLQPCDVQDEARNRQILQSALDYILVHPQWKLSLQTHKLIDVK